jgi:hypothetical protein
MVINSKKNVEIVLCYVEIHIVDVRDITKDNWFKDKEKTTKVMEEVQKIGEYYLRGGLSF